METKRGSGGPARVLGCALIALASAPAAAAAVWATTGRPTSSAAQASYYGPGLQGRRMADGRRLDRHKLTAAHRELPLGSRATVTNLANGKKGRGRDQRPRAVRRGDG